MSRCKDALQEEEGLRGYGAGKGAPGGGASLLLYDTTAQGNPWVLGPPAEGRPEKGCSSAPNVLRSENWDWDWDWDVHLRPQPPPYSQRRI